MLHKIELSEGKIFYYDPEYRILFKENNRDHPVQTKWFSDEDLREFHRKTQIIHDQIKKDN